MAADVSIADALQGKVEPGPGSHRQRLGPHPPRLQGRVLVRRDQRRLVLRRASRSSRRTRCRTTRARSCTSRPAARVIATGTLVQSQGKGQAFEIQATEVKVVGWVDDPDTYPISPEAAHVRVPARGRAPAPADEHVRRGHARAAHAEHGDPPVLPRARVLLDPHADHHDVSDAEGAGADVPREHAGPAPTSRARRTGKVDFAQDFFGKQACLTVSGQLNVETYCLAMSKVYTFGPTFRAEQSITPRHLAEFWMIEPEIAFADLKADADLAEAFLKYIFKAVLNERPDDMKFFAERIDKECVTRLEKFVDSSFERIDLHRRDRAPWRSRGKKFEFPVKWGIDLQTEHERYLTEEHVGRPVVVMNYPKEIKAFYMRLNDDGKTVAAMDVLAPGIGEIIGGSQREERLDVLDRRHRRDAPGQEGVLVVPRPAPLRHGPARGLRPGLRADDHVRDGHAEHPRRDPVPAHAEERGFLTTALHVERDPLRQRQVLRVVDRVRRAAHVGLPRVGAATRGRRRWLFRRRRRRRSRRRWCRC